MGAPAVLRLALVTAIIGAAVLGGGPWTQLALAAGPPERVSVSSSGVQGNGYSIGGVRMSGDGRSVVFMSTASNFATGDAGTSGDVFVRDRLLGTTTMMNSSAAGVMEFGSSKNPTISADGRYAAFATSSNFDPADGNFGTDIYVKDLASGAIERVSLHAASAVVGYNSNANYPALSADGRFVAFSSQGSLRVTPDGYMDVFVYDRQTSTTRQVSVPYAGAPTNDHGATSDRPSISADGRYVAFESSRGYLVPGVPSGKRVYLHDRMMNTTELVSRSSAGVTGDDQSFAPSISADGRLVTFYSYATNLVPGDVNGAIDVFVRDRTSGITELISVGMTGRPGNGHSGFSTISGDGRFVAFYSNSTDLVPARSFGQNLYIRDRTLGLTSRLEALAGSGIWGGGGYASLSLNGDGSLVAFDSSMTTIVPNDTNFQSDVFVIGNNAFPSSTNTAPHADAGADVTTAEGATVRLDATSSTDADGHPLTFVWTYVGGTGPAPSLSSATVADPTFVATDDGTFTFRVTVDDGKAGTSSDEVAISIANAPPAVVAGADRTAHWGVPVALDVASIQDPGAADTAAGFTVNWYLGDAVPSGPADRSGHDLFAVTHTYATPGDRVVMVEAIDKDGGHDTDEILVTIVRRPTVLSCTGGTATFGFPITLTATLTDAADPTTASLAGIPIQLDLATTDAFTDPTGLASAPNRQLLPGAYTVHASFTGNDLYDAATAVCPLTVVNSTGRITAGAVTTANDGRGGVTVRSDPARGVTGELEFHDTLLDLHARTFTAFGISPDGTKAHFAGVTTDGLSFSAYVEDNGEPGGADVFHLQTSGAGSPRTGGALNGGNVQIHR